MFGGTYVWYKPLRKRFQKFSMTSIFKFDPFFVLDAFRRWKFWGVLNNFDVNITKETPLSHLTVKVILQMGTDFLAMILKVNSRFCLQVQYRKVSQALL